MVALANSTAKALVNTALAVVEPVATFNRWIFSQLESGFQNAWRAFTEFGADAVNALMDRIRPALALLADTFGMDGAAESIRRAGGIQVARTRATPMTWEQAASESAQVRSNTRTEVGAFFDAGTDTARTLFGGQALEGAGALEELNARINALVAQRTASEEKATVAVKAGLPVATSRLQLAELERQSKDRLLALENRRAMVEANFGMTSAEKWRLKKATLEEERALLEGIVASLREKAALETDPAAREQFLGRADAFQSRLSGVQRGLGTMGPDPYSTTDQITSAVTGLQDQFGTTAQAIARSFTSVIGSAVDSVSQGIEGLIMGTMTWADALRNVARTMLTTIVQAISRMFAEWIAKRALAAMKNMIFSAQEGAADTAAKAPGAVLSSISSWGVAVAVGVAAIVAAMAAFGGFQAGGYTGDGASDRVAGVVHRGEFVMPAPAVQRIGLDNLEAMRAGAVPVAAAPVPAPQVSNDVRLAMFDSRVDARKWANSQDGETWFVDMARRTSHRWSRA